MIEEPRTIIAIIFGLLSLLLIIWVVVSLLVDDDSPEEESSTHTIVVRCNYCYNYNFYKDIRNENEIECYDCGRMNKIKE